MNPARLDNLTPEQQVLVTYYAANHGNSSWTLRPGLQKLCKAAKIDDTSLSREFRRLENMKLIVRDSLRNIKIVNEVTSFFILAHAIRRRWKALKIVEKVCTKAERWEDYNAEQRIPLMRWACGDSRDLPRHIIKKLFVLVDEAYTEDWFWRLFSAIKMPDERFEETHMILEHLFRENIDPAPVLDLLEKHCGPVDSNETHDLIAFYRYLHTGAMPPFGEPSKTRPVALLYHGMHALGQGENAQALKHFTDAMRYFNTLYEVKNTLHIVAPATAYAITLSRPDLPDAAKKMSAFIKKRDQLEQILFVPWIPFSIVTRALRNDRELTISELDTLKKTGDKGNGAEDILSSAFAKYLGATNGTLHTSPWAWLRYMGADVMKPGRENLADIYGRLGTFNAEHRREPWEWALDNITKQIADSEKISTKQQAPAEARVVYHANGIKSSLEPYLQTRLRNGEWSTPKRLPVKRFAAFDAPGMDDNDRAIARLVTSESYATTYSTMPSLAKAANLLIDSDRVYYDNDGNSLSTYTIRRAEPELRLDVDTRAQRIRVTANVSPENLDYDNYGTHVIAPHAGGNLLSLDVIPLDSTQTTVLRQLLRLGSFPMNAEERLRDFLLNISHVVNVKSKLVDDENVPTVAGSLSLVARVVPVGGDAYDIDIALRPLPGGKIEVVPGQGRAQIVDHDAQGRPTRVQRNLTAEGAALAALTDSLADLGDAFADNEPPYRADIDTLLDFLKYAADNPTLLDVEWPQGKAMKYRSTPAASSWKIALKNREGWFDIEGNLTFDDGLVLTMSQLLDMVGASRGKYVRLNDTDFVALDKRLRKRLERLEALAVRQGNKARLSAVNAAMLDDDTLAADDIAITTDKRLDTLRKAVRKADDYAPAVPEALNATLRPYQLDGFRWMARLASWGAGACLADDMGLGKTVQTIAFMLLHADKGASLVVAPASVVPNWVSELQRFAPSLTPHVLNSAADRAATIANAGPGDVIVTTYGLLNTEVEALAAKQFVTAILDEAHTIKNRDTKMSQAAMQLQATHRIILTGTPIQNHPGELWNLFRFINPGMLGSAEGFNKKYIIPITRDDDAARRRQLQRLLRPFMLRRTKGDVMDDLPEKTEVTLPIELSAEERSMYEALRRKTVAALEQAERLDVNTLAEITRLRRAACSMSLIDDSIDIPGSKVQALVGLIRETQDTPDNRMLVFSQFTTFFDIVRRTLDAEKIPYLYLDGSTTMARREKLIKEFRAGKCPVFLISLKAGGLGLNLPEANYVVHLDPWWNPAIEEQATDRAYRIGQQRAVTVYRLVAQGTIEEKILRLHRTKRNLADALLADAGTAAKLTLADMLALVSEGA